MRRSWVRLPQAAHPKTPGQVDNCLKLLYGLAMTNVANTAAEGKPAEVADQIILNAAQWSAILNRGAALDAVLALCQEWEGAPVNSERDLVRRHCAQAILY